MARTVAVLLYLYNGREYAPEEVDCYPLTENFVARKTDRGEWSITHLPTKYNLDSLFYGREKPASLSACKKLALALEPLGDWKSFTADARNKERPKPARKLKALGKKARELVATLYPADLG